jgi:acyl transferase domain-containing protein
VFKVEKMSENDSARMQPIAVVGVSALMPGSRDAAGFWRTVIEGRDLIREVPETHWLVDDYYDPDPAAPDKTYARRGAFLDAVDFEPMAYGVPPTMLEATDTTQLLSLVVAETLLADASCGNLDRIDRTRTGVILGTAPLDLLATMSNRLQRPVWLKALREEGIGESQAQSVCDRIAEQYVPWQEASFPGLLSNVVSGRIANRFDLGGSNYTTDAACASSLAAVSSAIAELSLGRADLMITGGVDTLNDIVMYMCFSKTPALSPTGDCRPFSDRADGTILGEGLVMLALRRLADAERDGDQVYAAIRGIGSSSDGRGSSIYAPVAHGQATAVRRAYDAAGYGPETVELVEAHGTGTKAGDAVELGALQATFAESRRGDAPWCAVGSLKSQFGHTKSAAGAAGLLKAVLALQHKVLPPTIKVDRPSAAIEADGPLYLNTAARPWIRDAGYPRRASVSSFGFGGTNFHVTVEEYLGRGAARPAPLARTAASELVLLGGSSTEQLVTRCRGLTTDNLAATARRTQTEFRPSEPARLAVVASDMEDLAAKLAWAADRIAAKPGGSFSLPTGIHYGTDTAGPGQVAFLFSGQGSQYVGMGADVAMSLPAARAAWDRAAGLRFDSQAVHQMVFPAPVFSDEERAVQEARLTATEWAQPALAVQSLALLDVLADLGVRPDCVAGHSFGELVALHAAGAFNEESLIRLARRRGELMRDAAGSTAGAMLAVTAIREQVEEILAAGGFGELWLANHNAPTQVVVSGTVDAIAALAADLGRRGITARRLNAATAFHSPLVAPAGEPLLEFLGGIEVRAPELDVYGNADADRYPADPEEVRRRLAGHLSRPVRFLDQIGAMHDRGVRTFVEVGAGSVLAGLVGQVLEGREHVAISLDRKGRNGITALHDALGRLAVAGLSLNFDGLWAAHADPAAEVKPARRAMTVQLLGTNYNKPYPPKGGTAVLPPPNPEPVHPAAPAHDATPDPLPVAEPVPVVPVEGDWCRTMEEVQRQLTEAHLAFQQLMADSHLAFLRSVQMPFGEPAEPIEVPAHSEEIRPVASAPQPVAAPAPEPARRQAPIPSARTAPEAAAAPSGVDIEELLLAVVSEVTGYPVSMLDTSMALEADLGVDSIKRVQILSAVRSSVPDLPEVDVAELGKLRSLSDIVARFRTATAPVGTGSIPSARTVPEATTAGDVEGVMLAAVADATGYPVSMLEMSMELEGDLGIDSIKRVQILSAVRTAVPNLPEVDVAELGKLRSLRDIAERLRQDGNLAVVPVVETTGAGAEPLVRGVVRAVPAPARGLPLGGLDGGRLHVTEDGAGIAKGLVATLTGRGLDAALVTDVPADAHGVIHLGGLRSASTVDGALAVNREVFRAARTVAEKFTQHGGVFVTVQDTGGDFGLAGREPDRAWLGGIAALTRTAAREWPSASLKAIDCERGQRDAQAIAEAIADELTGGGTTLEVGLRADGTRLTLKTAEVPVVADPVERITKDSVIVSTGGARGVTAATLRALAAAHQPRIVLIGRTELAEEDDSLRGAADEPAIRRLLIERAVTAGGRPPLAEVGAEVTRVLSVREIRGTIAQLERAGSEVRYVALDVRDADALAAALKEIRAAWGPVTGIVHGAGVLADKLIVDKSDGEFERVFETKVAGLRALLAATAGDPLGLLCVYSSVTARLGNPGQCDYAMANEVLNLLACAEQASRPGCRVLSIAWGPWRGGMVNGALAEHFLAQGVPLIPLEDGAAAFVSELDGATTDVQIMLTAGGTADRLTAAAAGRTAVA